jgi:protein required for attachment to host cells
MLQDGSTWFLLADGRRAKVLVEQRRGAPLQARDDLAMEIGPDELYEPQDRPPRNDNHAGAGRHTIDRGLTLHEQEEQNFLKKVAKTIGDAAKQNQFDHLVIAAPPKALGILRGELPDGVRQRVRAETPKDLLDEEAPKLRERLQELLRH